MAANRTSTVNNAVNSASNAVSSAVNTVSDTAVSLTLDSPEEFLKEAAQGGLAEVEMGNLAAKNAQSAEVKAFGQMMVSDHGKANAELKALAAKKNIELPADIGSHRSTIDKLKGLMGKDFDHKYVDAMVDDHDKDVSAFQAQADKSADPDVKAFAAKTLPVLKAHLEKIKAIQAQIEKAIRSERSANSH